MQYETECQAKNDKEQNFFLKKSNGEKTGVIVWLIAAVYIKC
jgi:hypothetical protein